MWVLKDGKKYYLEMLRNLSVQFLMTIFLLIMFDKLIKAVKISRYDEVAMFGLIVSVILLNLAIAIIANLKIFFDEASIGVSADFKEYQKNLKYMKKPLRIKMCATYLVKNKKIACIETALLILGVYFISVVGVYYSFESVNKLIITEPQIKIESNGQHYICKPYTQPR